MKKLFALLGLLIFFSYAVFSINKANNNQEYFKLIDSVVDKVIMLKETYGQIEDLTRKNLSTKNYPDKTIINLYYYDKHARQINTKKYLILRMSFTIWGTKERIMRNNIGRMEIVYSATGNEGENIQRDIANIIKEEKKLFPFDR